MTDNQIYKKCGGVSNRIFLLIAITLATDGAALTVLAEVAIGVGIGVGSYLLSCAISGEQVTAEGVVNAAVDSFVICSFFAFVSAGVNALSKMHRTSVEPTKEICTGWQCFIAGTLVLCMGADGKETHKPIEEIEVGDMVLAYDEQTGVTDWKPVVRLFRNETQEWHHIKVNNEEIVCTGEHPFYEAELKQFIPANKLKTGNKLLLSDGRCVTINAIEIERLTSPDTTYNFEVEDYHTYYVTESGVLVHNLCGKPKMANRGSTGRTEPNNLVEKLAMEQVKADPLNGAEMLNKVLLRDKRWLASEGWVKMQTVVRSGSHNTTIHFVYNQTLYLVDDFKFVFFKTLL